MGFLCDSFFLCCGCGDRTVLDVCFVMRGFELDRSIHVFIAFLQGMALLKDASEKGLFSRAWMESGNLATSGCDPSPFQKPNRLPHTAWIHVSDFCQVVLTN